MGDVLSYYEALGEAMRVLARDERTVFVGQSVAYSGQAAHDTFAGVPREKLLEFPVAEDLQLGFCCGLALKGFVPVCFYPRMDFLILAANQLVNHLDKASYLWGSPLRVLVRVAVGSTEPLNPGPQHAQDHTEALKLMLQNTHVVQLREAAAILPAYEEALERDGPTILVEYMSYYRRSPR